MAYLLTVYLLDRQSITISKTLQIKRYFRIDNIIWPAAVAPQLLGN